MTRGGAGFGGGGGGGGGGRVAAVRGDSYSGPPPLLLPLLTGGRAGAAPILSRAGAQVPALKAALTQALTRLPKVEGQGGEVAISRELNNLLNLTDKEAMKRNDAYIASA